MRRREFIAILGGAAAGWPLAAHAQRNKVRRVGVLMNGAADETDRQVFLTEFVSALRGLGWVEGKSVHIDVRWNVGNADLARTYAAQLIGLMPDALFVASTTNLKVMLQATNTIPVVFIQITDPVAQGLVPNLTRPGGNVTGFYGTEFSIASKWMELLKQVSPKLGRVAVIFNPATSPQSKFYLPAIESGGRTFDVQVVAKPVRSSADI
jgi:putative ABC transport system substrate-binding protein